MESIRIIRHKSINQQELQKICEIKAKSWQYDFDSQQRWINNNISGNDIHVILENNETPLAYLNLVSIYVIINDVPIEAFGVGNVCSVEKGVGYGSNLLLRVNEYILKESKIGVLFCNKKLLPFYKKLNWRCIDKKYFLFNKEKVDFEIMVFNIKAKIDKLSYNGKYF